MKEYTILTFEESLDYLGLSQDAWSRVRSAPKEEYAQAIRRELYWPEGFLESLKGKSLQEQMACYRIIESSCSSRTAYGEITKENCHRFGYALEDYKDLLALIVDDGILLGVCMNAWACYNRYGRAAFPYQEICTYYASDDNGSGSKDREDNAHLCCVLPQGEV